MHNCTVPQPPFRHTPSMRIGVIGSGKMGTGLGRLWAKRGHYVMFSYARSPERLQHLVTEIGPHAQWGTPEEAVRFADVLLLAVPWSGIGDALVPAGPLDGTTILTCVNPVGPLGLEVGLTSSAAEEIAKLAPGAIVVEAFNTIFAEIIHSTAHLFGYKTPTVFIAGTIAMPKLRQPHLSEMLVFSLWMQVRCKMPATLSLLPCL